MLDTVNGYDEKKETQTLLNKTFFSYIGYHHVQNINKELIEHKEEIKDVEIPVSLDEWFSKFNNRIENIKRINKYKHIFKAIISKIAIVFFIFVISVTILTVTVNAFRVQVLNMIIENTPKYLDIKVGEKIPKEGEFRHDLKEHYLPNYIPKGFKLSNIDKYDKTTIITYVNHNNQSILFTQAPYGTNFQIDSENSVIKEVDIDRVEGIALIKG